MKNRYSLFFVLMFFLFESCSNSNLIKPYEFSNGWKNNEIAKFDFKVKDSESRHNLFLILRHNKNYAFSNIFMVTQLYLGDDLKHSDTLEYKLSSTSGKWLGNKKLSVVEHVLPFKENFELLKDSLYTLSVRNSMRLINEISPIQNLENVLDLGMLIERAN